MHEYKMRQITEEKKTTTYKQENFTQVNFFFIHQMGACIGKKSSKYLLRKISQSDRDLNPQSKEQSTSFVKDILV